MNASTACTGVSPAGVLGAAGRRGDHLDELHRLDPDHHHHGADDTPDDQPDHLAPDDHLVPDDSAGHHVRGGIHRRQRHDGDDRLLETSTSSCTSAKQALKTAGNTRDQTLQKDRLAVTSAEQAQDATVDKDQQAIVTAQGQVRDAQLTAEADLHPQTPAQIAQARSDVDSAQVQVDTATRTLDGTVLKAPIAGVVLAVNGKVGQSSGSTSSSTSSTSGAGDVRHVERGVVVGDLGGQRLHHHRQPERSWRSRRTSPRRTPPASSSASRPPSRSRPRTTPRPGPSRRSPRRAR